MSSLTIGVGGEAMGRASTGPLSPGFEPLHPLIKAMRFNLQAYDWPVEMREHRPTGVLPNLAPVGLQFVARRIRTVTPQSRGGYPVSGASPRFGSRYAGV